MKVVIQCAGRKQPGAASLQALDGRPVRFVAHPELAPPSPTHAHARPDDVSEDGRSWRERLLDYNNRESKANPLRLLPAWRLYARDAYADLVGRFGVDQVFILSAGWGLIPSAFLTPDYDITFTASADPWQRRRRSDAYDDFCIIPDDGDDIVFLGGQDYLPLFCRLTARLKAGKRVFFRPARLPGLPEGFTAIRYQTSTRTNWHYECARDLVAGRIEL